MTDKTYHIGLLKGVSRSHLWANGHRDSTVVVRVAQDIDYLSCDLWQYLGEHITTIAKIRKQKTELLQAINAQYKTDFKHIVIE